MNRLLMFITLLSLASLTRNAFAAGPHFTNAFMSNSNSASASGWWRNGSNLDLDFLNDRYHVGATSYSSIGAFDIGVGATFTRASTATYYNSSGILQTATSGVPRLDYDPSSLGALGLLVEPSSTNYVVNSGDSSTWALANVTVSGTDSITAPDGTSLAYRVIPSTANTVHFIGQGISAYSALPNTYYTCSVYYKTAGNTLGAIELWGFATTPTNVTTALPNGWYRYSSTASTGATVPGGRPTCYVFLNVYGGFAGDGTSGIYLWGMQMEVGTSATSYIPTTSAPVTRAADVLSIPTSTWLIATAGTLLVNQEYTSGVPDYNPIIGNASELDSFGITYQGIYGNHICPFVDGSASGTGVVFGSSGMYKSALTYSATQNQISVSGGAAITTATSKNLSTATRLLIGQDFNGLSSPPKHVGRLVYFGNAQPTAALPDYSK